MLVTDDLIINMLYLWRRVGSQAKQANGKEGDESSLAFGAAHSDSSTGGSQVLHRQIGAGLELRWRLAVAQA